MEDNPGSTCVLIDDIFNLLVESRQIPYGVTKHINKLINKRDEKDGLDEASARCIRMIELVDTQLSNIEKQKYARYNEITLNFGTQTVVMNAKYSSKRYHFLYLAFKIAVFESKKESLPYISMEKTWYNVEELFDTCHIKFGGYDGQDSLNSKRLKLLFTIKAFNIFSAMCGDPTRYSEVYSLEKGWNCTDCGENIDRCNRNCTDHYRKLVYEYRYVFTLNEFHGSTQSWFQDFTY